MADTKANMLITTASILITLSAPHVVNPAFRVPVIILGVSCLLTIVLAVYTLMPKLGRPGKGERRPDVQSPGFNLLFFGDFTKLDYAEFEAAMEEMMNDPNRTYQAQVREVYALGLFLATRKYRSLRLAYLVFLAGLLASGMSLVA